MTYEENRFIIISIIKGKKKNLDKEQQRLTTSFKALANQKSEEYILDSAAIVWENIKKGLHQ